MSFSKNTGEAKKSSKWNKDKSNADEVESSEDDEYILAMKRVHNQTTKKTSLPAEIMSPRERYRNRSFQVQGLSRVHVCPPSTSASLGLITTSYASTLAVFTLPRNVSRMDGSSRSWNSLQQATRISTVASMVPDEIIYKHSDYSIRSYETALMFIDVSGFTELCESYTKPGRGGPSRLTQVLNSYIGAMIQEILMHNGDILKFSGDAFLSMWKKTPRLTMQDVVHTAIDCGLLIQKNYGTYVTDIGVVLKVKVAISAGMSHFSIIGGIDSISQSHYVIVGQPVWDVKMAEYLSTAGDVLTTASAWMYVNEAEYCTQPCGDGRHTKVLGIGATWKRVENPIHSLGTKQRDSEPPTYTPTLRFEEQRGRVSDLYYREFSHIDTLNTAGLLVIVVIVKSGELDLICSNIRPAVISALKSSWWSSLRRFMVTPVLRAVDNDEPMDYLTEVRRVVVVFLNIITKTVTEDVLIKVVDTAYECVSRLTSALGGLVNKVSMFDKDMMFLVVFGLRGLKQDDEAQKALMCAYQIKENLNDLNITSVSIGVTSGTTYCGVVGHVLRREYTVIGSAVNKAARLMIAYPMRVTCDKETFLRSKLDQEHFKMVAQKPLKGIPKPGPIYEFNKHKWPERKGSSRHPLLGRSDELRRYKQLIYNAIKEHKTQFTRYKDHKFCYAIVGPDLVGKTRLLEECLYITPHEVHSETFLLTEKDTEPFTLFRMLMYKAFADSDERSKRIDCENILRYSLNLMNLTAIQIYALNSIFDSHFPLPENYSCQEDILSNMSVKHMLQELFKCTFERLWVAAIKEAQFMDDYSWRLLIIIMETKTVFFLLVLPDDQMSETARKTLENGMVVKMPLAGVDRWYHAALACQLLDVQAIPADLEKVIESASGGMPGWIQNFVISLVQRGVLTVVTVSRGEARISGVVMPSPALLQKKDFDPSSEENFRRRLSYQSIYSFMSVSTKSRQESLFNVHESDAIQMAVLSEGYSFGDMVVDMTMDATILKTYDSLTPFEKMLLKCGSVLGDVFSRRMLLHLLQSDSPRKVAQAVAKLFTIRVLECEGGDFTRDVSLVLVNPAPALPEAKPPCCACLGIRAPPTCRDLPSYAFCGYMKFRHTLFRTTTYDLLTESQKHEMHSRALLYLERYTRRCVSCGMGCFAKLLGVRSDDGLVVESEEVKRIRQQICALNADTRVCGEDKSPLYFASTTTGMDIHCGYSYLAQDASSYDIDIKQKKNFSHTSHVKEKHVRSFSSLEIFNCECLSILLAVYCQIIEHCRGAGEYEKLFEAYMEYADLNIINQNIPQAIRLLFEVETFLQSDKLSNTRKKWDWMKDFRLASILTLRGVCMLESSDIGEARKQLFNAMKLYYDPFPTSNHSVRLRDLRASFVQRMALYYAPQWYVGVDRGIVGQFYEDIAKTLNTLYRLFIETKEDRNATLAAKWSLNYALRTNANFRVLCISYGNMITTYKQQQKFSICETLLQRAVELCLRKCGQLDVTEVHAVCYLYTSIFLFYVEHGKKVESMVYGLSVMHIMSSLTDLSTRQMLILWMLKLLLSDLRLHDMVSIMNEFFYVSDHYDLSSLTWYYFYALVIMLDTGYCVESYGTCERFYIKKGDAILRARTPEAAWNFFVCMWLITIRIGAWERSILWEEKIKQILTMKFEKHEFNIMILSRLVEGLLITLVKEMDNRNIKKILQLEKALKSMFQEMNDVCTHTTMYMPRYYLLNAYFHFMRGKKLKGFRFLNKCSDISKQYSHGTVLVWVEHTRNHWKGLLNPFLENYWVDHMEPDQMLHYKDFDLQKSKIVPYTLPLPRDYE